MTLADAIKEMIHRSGLTQKKLAGSAGYNTVSSVTTPIAKNDMSVSTLLRLANAAGYDLMLVRHKPDAFNPEYPIRVGIAGKVNTED